MYQEQENLGICRFCQAPNKRSRNTGKVYCSERCWLKNQPQQSQSIQRQEPNWDAIRERKEESIEWVSSKNNACLILAQAIRQGMPYDDAMKRLPKLVNYIFQINEEPKDLRDNPQQNISEENNGSESGW